ncbi:MAG: SLC13 family permease [marine bacterium B5-7]|nr:MAG: SLC13 family permease [marine bacterium B5-7]
MFSDQTILFGLLTLVFALLIWGRIRYDLVAFGALVLAVILGVVPTDQAFEGFGHPATIIIALVLIISRALSNSGVVDMVAKMVSKTATSLFTHISVMAAVAAGLSAIMNNVAALALLMPVDIKAAVKAGRSPAMTLMPLSFASILGGMITLIGTPPNIIVSAFRKETLGESFSMFDFTPVGLACAVSGVLFVSLIGWRLIPKGRRDSDSGGPLFDIGNYIAEVRVDKKSSTIGKQVRELDDVCDEHGVSIIGVIRNKRRIPGGARSIEIADNDILVIEADATSIDGFAGDTGLVYEPDAEKDKDDNKDNKDNKDRTLAGEQVLTEAVVTPGARIAGRSAHSMKLLDRYGITLLGVSRQGRRFRQQIRSLTLHPGDVLLLLGPEGRLGEIIEWIGALPLADRELEITKRNKVGAAIAIFGCAIAAASAGLLYLPIALALACILFIGLGFIRGRQVYDAIEWPVIVLLGSMIPLGTALESSGGTERLAQLLVDAAGDYGPVTVLTIFMIATMTLSDVLNNTATTIIAAPVAMDIASSLDVSPDPFLMAVAVAASCAFLTPIGHKNNTLILGPGGYRFGDYWRMGLPLEILIVAVGVPAIMIFWPL